jgi:3-oxoacyl-[acyl-carrier-protein] synthase-3
VLYLHGIGHFHPENVIDNDFLASLDIGADPTWVEERVGILQRRTSMSLDYIRQTKNADTRAAAEGSTITTTEMGKRAAEAALARAGLNANSLGMIVAGGCCPEMLIPAEASRMAAALGIPALTFDLSAACASFVAHLHFLMQMRSETLPDFILVTSIEAFTRTINYADRKTAVLFGDGATATIVSPRVPAPARIVESRLQTDPSGHDQVTIPAGGHFDQDGNRVQMFAIRKTVEAIGEGRFSANGNGHSHRREIFIGHQANLRMLEAVCKRLGVAPENHLFNVKSFGNCGAAGAPSVLSQHWDDLGACAVNLAVVGSGLSWGAVRICLAEREANS